MTPSLLGGLVIQLLLAQAALDRMAHTPIAYADEVPVQQQIPLPPSFTFDHKASIAYWASKFDADAKEMSQTIQCESQYRIDAVGDHGTSFGLVQIHLPAHPDVSQKQALDPDFSVKWMAEHWYEKRIWSCARILGFE